MNSISRLRTKLDQIRNRAILESICGKADTELLTAPSRPRISWHRECKRRENAPTPSLIAS